MADETWSAKATPELKEEINQLKGSTPGKEFLELLVSQYKLGLLQGSDAERSEDIQQVTYHLDKIKSSFVGLVERGIDLKDKFNQSLAHESLLHKEIVDQQQGQIKLALEDRDRAVLDRAELEKVMVGITARSSELEEINTSQRITIQMQMDKLNQLEARIGSVSELEQEVNRLLQDNQMQSKQVETLERDLTDHKRQLEITQASMETQEREAIKATEQLVQVHGLEIQRATLETEKRIKDEYLLKVEALTDKNQELTEKLHQMQLAKPTKARTVAVKGKDVHVDPEGQA